MRFQIRTLALIATSALLFGGLPSAPAQGQSQFQTPIYSPPYSTVNRDLLDNLRRSAVGHYPGSVVSVQFSGTDQSFAAMNQVVRQAETQSQSGHAAYEEYLERQRLRAAQTQAIRAQLWATQAHADPDAPDQSDLLKNSHDRDFILRNFHTMYVEAYDAQYFGSDQMKAALGRNQEFQKLNIRIVDDPRVADTVLKVSYTFAWDYPFELRHQNTTFVLVAGKGEGPFSGPLGAADVARQFVNAVKDLREAKKAAGK